MRIGNIFMFAFTPLIYIAVAFGIIAGVVKAKRFGRFLLGLAIGPILLGVPNTVTQT